MVTYAGLAKWHCPRLEDGMVMSPSLPWNSYYPIPFRRYMELLSMSRYDRRYAHCRYDIEGKLHLEEMMRRHPQDGDLRTEYFEFIRQLSRRFIGMLYALLPELPHPLLFWVAHQTS